jgi:hypothetical protein
MHVISVVRTFLMPGNSNGNQYLPGVFQLTVLGLYCCFKQHLLTVLPIVSYSFPQIKFLVNLGEILRFKLSAMLACT